MQVNQETVTCSYSYGLTIGWTWSIEDDPEDPKWFTADEIAEGIPTLYVPADNDDDDDDDDDTNLNVKAYEEEEGSYKDRDELVPKEKFGPPLTDGQAGRIRAAIQDNFPQLQSVNIWVEPNRWTAGVVVKILKSIPSYITAVNLCIDFGWNKPEQSSRNTLEYAGIFRQLKAFPNLYCLGIDVNNYPQGTTFSLDSVNALADLLGFVEGSAPLRRLPKLSQLHLNLPIGDICWAPVVDAIWTRDRLSTLFCIDYSAFQDHSEPKFHMTPLFDLRDKYNLTQHPFVVEDWINALVAACDLNRFDIFHQVFRRSFPSSIEYVSRDDRDSEGRFQIIGNIGTIPAKLERMAILDEMKEFFEKNPEELFLKFEAPMKEILEKAKIDLLATTGS